MSKIRVVLTLAAALIAAVVVSGGRARAQVDAPALSTFALDNLFTALNDGNAGLALDAFDTRAFIKNLPARESYLDVNQVAAVLEGWERDGRSYVVTHESVTNIARGLDLVVSEVDISDRGVTWGRERIRAVVSNGKIQSLYVVHARLTPWQYW